MNSYSQHGEDKIFAPCFAAVSCGRRLLDLGAGDPVRYSNSRAFIESDWAAVLVEASPVTFCRLMDAYREVKNVTLIMALIMPEQQWIEWHEQGGDVSTASQWKRDIWKDKAAYQTYHRRAITVQDILGNFGVNFDFISIDIEGESCRTVCQMPWEDLPQCRAVCLERDTQDITLLADAKLREHGFRQIGKTALNNLYWRVVNQ